MLAERLFLGEKQPYKFLDPGKSMIMFVEFEVRKVREKTNMSEGEREMLVLG